MTTQTRLPLRYELRSSERSVPSGDWEKMVRAAGGENVRSLVIGLVTVVYFDHISPLYVKSFARGKLKTKNFAIRRRTLYANKRHDN